MPVRQVSRQFSGSQSILHAPNLLSLLAAPATSLTSSDCVYGRSLLDVRRGSRIRARNDLRVFGAPRTVIEEMVVGRVEFWSMRSASLCWLFWKVAWSLSLIARFRASMSKGSARWSFTKMSSSSPLPVGAAIWLSGSLDAKETIDDVSKSFHHVLEGPVQSKKLAGGDPPIAIKTQPCFAFWCSVTPLFAASCVGLSAT